MVKLSFVILFTLIFMRVIIAQTEYRTIENKAFGVGEKLKFELSYGFVTAGIANIEIPKKTKILGRDTYQIKFNVNSVSTFDPIFKVRDRYLSYVDVDGIFPWKFEQHIREGGFSKDFSAFFDQRKGIARTSDGKYDVPKYANDVVSAFYFFRTMDFNSLNPGDVVELQNFYNNKVYPLNVKIIGYEKVTVGSGTFDCVMIEPLVVEGGLFKHDGNIVVWLSNDEARLPVKMQSKIIIGSVVAELVEYEGVKGELSAKIL